MRIFALILALFFTTYAACEDFSKKQAKELAGAMLIVGFKGHLIDDPSVKIAQDALKEGKIGGVILFSSDTLQNIKSKEQLKAPNNALQSVAKHAPALICTDQEGGRVARLGPKSGFKEWQSAAKLGQLGVSATAKMADEMGAVLAGVGINFNFAPVVDLKSPQSPVIAGLDRAYSNDPKEVSAHALAFMQGMKKHGVISAIKHFPGHGLAAGDTHEGFVDASDTWQESELTPYKELLRLNGGGFAIMSAHVVLQQRSGLPASLSKEITSDLLRGELGFDGVVVTDDLQMKAVADHFTLKERILLAVNAGADLLLFGNNLDYQPGLANAAHKALLELIDEGKITQGRIKESIARINRLKSSVLGHYPPQNPQLVSLRGSRRLPRQSTL